MTIEEVEQLPSSILVSRLCYVLWPKSDPMTPDEELSEDMMIHFETVYFWEASESARQTAKRRDYYADQLVALQTWGGTREEKLWHADAVTRARAMVLTMENT